MHTCPIECTGRRVRICPGITCSVESTTHVGARVPEPERVWTIRDVGLCACFRCLSYSKLVTQLQKLRKEKHFEISPAKEPRAITKPNRTQQRNRRSTKADVVR